MSTCTRTQCHLELPFRSFKLNSVHSIGASHAEWHLQWLSMTPTQCHVELPSRVCMLYSFHSTGDSHADRNLQWLSMYPYSVSSKITDKHFWCYSTYSTGKPHLKWILQLWVHVPDLSVIQNYPLGVLSSIPITPLVLLMQNDIFSDVPCTWLSVM